MGSNDPLTIESVTDLISYLENPDILRDIIRIEPGEIPRNLWYRGQANENWSLQPKVFGRNDKDGNIISYSEYNVIEEFKIKTPQNHKICKSDFDWLCVGQHYSLPTRLLDWSTNALIGLYSCVADKECKGKNGKLFVLHPTGLNVTSIYCEGVLVQDSDIVRLWSKLPALSYTDSLYEIDSFNNILKRHNNDRHKVLEMLGRPAACGPTHTMQRLRLQSSVFTLHGGLSLANYLLTNNNPNSTTIPFPESIEDINGNSKHKFLLSFIIPAKLKERIKNQLDVLGVNEAFIFPEQEYQASYLAEKWLLKAVPD